MKNKKIIFTLALVILVIALFVFLPREESGNKRSTKQTPKAQTNPVADDPVSELTEPGVQTSLVAENANIVYGGSKGPRGETAPLIDSDELDSVDWIDRTRAIKNTSLIATNILTTTPANRLKAEAKIKDYLTPQAHEWVREYLKGSVDGPGVYPVKVHILNISPRYDETTGDRLVVYYFVQNLGRVKYRGQLFPAQRYSGVLTMRLLSNEPIVDTLEIQMTRS